MIPLNIGHVFDTFMNTFEAESQKKILAHIGGQLNSEFRLKLNELMMTYACQSMIREDLTPRDIETIRIQMVAVSSLMARMQEHVKWFANEEHPSQQAKPETDEDGEQVKVADGIDAVG